MNALKKIFSALMVLVTIYSCDTREGEVPCPDPDVRIHVYAERFRNRSQDPLVETELLFCERINHIRYYLYRNGSLFREGIVDTFKDRTIGFYSFDFTDIPAGSYNLIMVSNSTRAALAGDPTNPDNLVLTYPGSMDAEDYFSAVYPFNIPESVSMEPKLYEYTVGLSRVQGVIRYTFNNLPEDVIGVGVWMENVGLERWITSDYRKTYIADRRFDFVPVTRQAETTEYVMGTFPTVKDGYSTFRLGLFRQGENEPYLSEMITDDLTIIRNQLLDLSVNYENGEFSFEILMDSSWGGSTPGGEVGID